jgi:hypothetical protein
MDSCWLLFIVVQPQNAVCIVVLGGRMPVAEIASAITSFRASLDILKAMVTLRDEEAFRSKSIELQNTITDALEKSIEAREAYAKQLDRVRDLEAEIARLKAWEVEKQNYEMKKCGEASVAYMLKPEARGKQPPHWLCPNCFENGRKSILVATGKQPSRLWLFKCTTCMAEPACYHMPQWQD